MAGKKRTKAQRENDLQTLASMYLRGYSQSFIARHLGMSQPQISLDLQKLYKLWRESAVMDFNEAKQRELHRIDVLEREYWRAWRESKVARQRTRTAKTAGQDGERTTAQVDKEEQTGDPRYLTGVQWCIEQRAKIIGINAPTKSEVTGADGGANKLIIEVVRRDDANGSTGVAESSPETSADQNASQPL